MTYRCSTCSLMLPRRTGGADRLPGARRYRAWFAARVIHAARRTRRTSGARYAVTRCRGGRSSPVGSPSTVQRRTRALNAIRPRRTLDTCCRALRRLVLARSAARTRAWPKSECGNAARAAIATAGVARATACVARATACLTRATAFIVEADGSDRSRERPGCTARKLSGALRTRRAVWARQTVRL